MGIIEFSSQRVKRSLRGKEDPKPAEIPDASSEKRERGILIELGNHREELRKNDFENYIRDNKKIILRKEDFSENMQTYMIKDVNPGDGYWDASHQRRTENSTITVDLTYMDAESNISYVQIDLSQIGGFNLQSIMDEIIDRQEDLKRRGHSSEKENSDSFRSVLADALSPMLEKAGFKNEGLRYFTRFSKELMEEINRSVRLRDQRIKNQQRRKFNL